MNKEQSIIDPEEFEPVDQREAVTPPLGSPSVGSEPDISIRFLPTESQEERTIRNYANKTLAAYRSGESIQKQNEELKKKIQEKKK